MLPVSYWSTVKCTSVFAFSLNIVVCTHLPLISARYDTKVGCGP